MSDTPATMSDNKKDDTSEGGAGAHDNDSTSRNVPKGAEQKHQEEGEEKGQEPCKQQVIEEPNSTDRAFSDEDVKKFANLSISDKTSQDDTFILLWNIGGGKGKVGEITKLCGKKIPIIILNEVGANLENISNDYKCYRSQPGKYTEHKSKSRDEPWALAAILVRNGLNPKEIDLNDIQRTVGGAYLCAVCVDYKGKEWKILAAYIPRTRNHVKFNFANFENWILEENFTIICGDFNAHHSAWGSEPKTPGEKIKKMLDDKEMKIMNDGRPTFCRGNVKSCLDLIAVESTISGRFRWNVEDIETVTDHAKVWIDCRELLETEEGTVKKDLQTLPHKPL